MNCLPKKTATWADAVREYEICNERFKREEMLEVMRSEATEKFFRTLKKSLGLKGGSIGGTGPVIPDCVCTQCHLKPDCCADMKKGATQDVRPQKEQVVHCDCAKPCECNVCEKDTQEYIPPTCPCDECMANDYKNLLGGKNGNDSCVCVSPSFASNDPSVFSIRSADLVYMSKLEELAARDKKLRMKICELEHREKAYVETLKQADEMWAAMEECYKRRLSGVQNEGDGARQEYEKMSVELMEENARLADEVQDLRLELKQCMERVKGPMSRQLEQEKRKSEMLESRLEMSARDLANRQNTFNSNLGCLQDQLNNTCSCMYEVNALNEQLKNEMGVLKCKYNSLQQDLVAQKINEGHTLKQLNEALEEARAKIAELTKPPEEKPCSEYTLNELARCLSRSLLELEDCERCRCIPPDLRVTVEAIKNLVDLVDKKNTQGEEQKKQNNENRGDSYRRDDDDGNDPGTGGAGGGSSGGTSRGAPKGGGTPGNDEDDDDLDGGGGGPQDAPEVLGNELVLASKSKKLPPGENSVEITTEIQTANAMNLQIDTAIHEVNEAANSEEVTITTTVTKSGVLEVVTEGPLSIIETKMIYGEDGRVEISTEITDKTGKKKAAGGDVPDNDEIKCLNVPDQPQNVIEGEEPPLALPPPESTEDPLPEDAPAEETVAEEISAEISVDTSFMELLLGDYKDSSRSSFKNDSQKDQTTESVIPVESGDYSVNVKELCSSENYDPPPETTTLVAFATWDNGLFESYFAQSSFCSRAKPCCEELQDIFKGCSQELSTDNSKELVNSDNEEDVYSWSSAQQNDINSQHGSEVFEDIVDDLIVEVVRLEETSNNRHDAVDDLNKPPVDENQTESVEQHEDVNVDVEVDQKVEEIQVVEEVQVVEETRLEKIESSREMISKLETQPTGNTTKRHSSTPLIETTERKRHDTTNKRPYTEPRDRRLKHFRPEVKEKKENSSVCVGTCLMSFSDPDVFSSIECYGSLISEMEKNLGECPRAKEAAEILIEGALKEIKCSCYEAVQQAAITSLRSKRSFSSQKIVSGTSLVYQNTLSELHLALVNLQDKCHKKDMVIAEMMEDLKTAKKGGGVEKKIKKKEEQVEDKRKEKIEEKKPQKLQHQHQIKMNKKLTEIKKNLNTKTKKINTCPPENYAQENYMIPTIIHYVPIGKRSSEKPVGISKQKEIVAGKLKESKPSTSNHQANQTMSSPFEMPIFSTHFTLEEPLQPDVIRDGLEILETRQVSRNDVLVKWRAPACLLDLAGYEVTVNGTPKTRTHSAKRTSAILHDFPDSKVQHNIAVYCLDKSSGARHHPPARASFQLV